MYIKSHSIGYTDCVPFTIAVQQLLPGKCQEPSTSSALYMYRSGVFVLNCAFNTLLDNVSRKYIENWYMAVCQVKCSETIFFLVKHSITKLLRLVSSVYIYGKVSASSSTIPKPFRTRNEFAVIKGTYFIYITTIHNWITHLHSRQPGSWWIDELVLLKCN